MFSTIYGFDPKTFSDDALYEKHMELIKKSYMASKFGKSDAIEQIQSMIYAIEQERKERMWKNRIGDWMMDTRGTVIETDPDIRKKAEDEKEAEEAITAKKHKPIRRPIRSLKPTKTENGDL
jgi:hypothetical protein